MKRKSSFIPAIRVGDPRVTYTPPAPWPKGDRYSALVFRCTITRLLLDGSEVPEIDPERTYYNRDVRADLRTSTGGEIAGVPYEDCCSDEAATGSWCRPYITRAEVRFG